jgi:hypothetical protein
MLCIIIIIQLGKAQTIRQNERAATTIASREDICTNDKPTNAGNHYHSICVPTLQVAAPRDQIQDISIERRSCYQCAGISTVQDVADLLSIEKGFQTDFKGEARLVTNLTNRGDEDGAVSRAGGTRIPSGSSTSREARN